MTKHYSLLMSLLATPFYFCFAAEPDYAGVTYGSESRQFLDIYLAPSDSPTPVYINAHANGGTTDMPDDIVNDLKAAGISTVSWESLRSVGTPEQVDTAWNDADLMYAWLKANAEIYNFDTTNFIVGGSSRGSVVSWKIAHSGDPAIKGIYMYNALPDKVWTFQDWWTPTEDITVLSPPIFLVYRYEPGHPDSHDAENGIIITNKYDSLGIGDRDTLVHSITYTDNNDRFQFLVEFALSVIGQGPVLSLDSNKTLDLKVFPNPFRDKFEVSGLKGNEYFVLTTLTGAIKQEGYKLDSFKLDELNTGMYFLTIQSRDGQQILRLLKN